MTQEFRRLIKGAMARDRDRMNQAALAIGYYDTTTRDHHRETILDMGGLAIEPFTLEGPYDFGTSDVLARLRARGIELGLTATSGNCHHPTRCCCNASSAACTCWRSGCGRGSTCMRWPGPVWLDEDPARRPRAEVHARRQRSGRAGRNIAFS